MGLCGMHVSARVLKTCRLFFMPGVTVSHSVTFVPQFISQQVALFSLFSSDAASHLTNLKHYCHIILKFSITLKEETTVKMLNFLC